LSKENEPIERTAYHSPLRCWSAFSGLPCAAHKERTIRKVDSLRRIVFPFFFVLPSFVKWPNAICMDVA